jgi:hypothetical protein
VASEDLIASTRNASAAKDMVESVKIIVEYMRADGLLSTSEDALLDMLIGRVIGIIGEVARQP